MKFLSLLPIIVTLVGVYLLIKLRAFFIIHPIKVFKKMTSALSGNNSAVSLSLALAGTLGVGNIVGVAVGIAVGGAGSVFWLLLSAVFASVIKYAEATVSSDLGEGLGMIGVARRILGKGVSKIYAFLVLLLCFFMGAMLQSSTISESIGDTVGIPNAVSAAVLALLLVPIILLGSDKIEKITSAVIPLTTIIYIFLTVSTIIVNFQEIPNALLCIVSSAFSLEALGGGVLGIFLSAAVREGYMRGILSNEAGAGTSTLAHARNKTEDPTSVGLMGMCEVFFDTVVLCMLTALSILVSLGDEVSGSGMDIILSSIGDVYGNFSRFSVVICIFFFAYSTVICWYYYGECAYSYLSSGKGKAYTFLFAFSVLFGALISGKYLISVTDVLLFLLSLISLFITAKCSDRIKTLSEHSGLIIRR